MAFEHCKSESTRRISHLFGYNLNVLGSKLVDSASSSSCPILSWKFNTTVWELAGYPPSYFEETKRICCTHICTHGPEAMVKPNSWPCTCSVCLRSTAQKSFKQHKTKNTKKTQVNCKICLKSASLHERDSSLGESLPAWHWDPQDWQHQVPRSYPGSLTELE